MSWAHKDPDSSDWYFFIFCDPQTGLNDGSANDDGDLQGATISSHTVTPASGITLADHNRNAVTIKGVTYAANTLVAAKLSGGSAGSAYAIECKYTTSDGRTDLVKTEMLYVENL